jgi:hypothetical protein
LAIEDCGVIVRQWVRALSADCHVLFNLPGGSRLKPNTIAKIVLVTHQASSLGSIELIGGAFRRL